MHTTTGDASSANDGAQSKKPVCDKYENNGVCLSKDQIDACLLSIHDEWLYNPVTNSICRTYKFPRNAPGNMTESNRPKLVGVKGCYAFFNMIGTMSMNEDHGPYSIQLIPRKAAVVVEMKTVARAGLTYADFMFAFKLDAAFATN